jgi:dCTP deaminase
VISDNVLRGLVMSGRLVGTPSERYELYGSVADSQIQPASIDVRLSHDLLLFDRGGPYDLIKNGNYLMEPEECVLGSLVERLAVPSNMVGWIEGKSSIGRQFLKVHSAGFIDPGFQGDITLELKNESKRWQFSLEPGMLIAQVRFAYLDAVAARPYGHVSLGSHYQGQSGTTEADV